MYPYLFYNNKTKAKALIRAFLTMWQVNHVSQHLAAANVNVSKIAEFGLSVDGQ